MGRLSINESPGYDIKQSDSEIPVMLELWWIQSTPSLPSLPGPHLPRVVGPDRVLSMVQIELTSVLMLNWTVCKRTVLTFNLCTNTKLNCLKWNCFLYLNCLFMLNLIVWNRTVLAFNCEDKKLYGYKTELFEIELFTCTKMDLH